MFFRDTRRLQKQRHPLRRVVRLVLYVASLGGAAVAGAGVGGMLAYVDSQPIIRRLEYYDPHQVTRVFGRYGRQVIAEFYDKKREVLSLSEMRPELPLAFIAIEDQRFRKHFGVDPRGIARAMLTNARRGAVRQGGSTITQQLTRNIMPQEIGNSRDLARKIREALAALVIEKRYSKDQILEFYLNHIFLGCNSYGVQSAAHTYFGKDARDLTIGECAALAAIPKAPTTLNPRRSPEKLTARRNLVLRTMESLRTISPDIARREIKRPLETRDDSRPRVVSPYFVDLVQRTLMGDPDLEDDLLNRGGYHIYSTEEPKFQAILEQEIALGLPRVEELWQQGKRARQRYEEREILEKYKTQLPIAGQERLARIVARHEDRVDVELHGYRGTAKFPKNRYAAKGEPSWHLPYYEPDRILRKGELLDIRIRSVNSAKRTMKVEMVDRTRIQGAAVLLDAQTGNILGLVGGADFYDRPNNGMWNRATRGGRQPGSAFKPLLYATALDQAGYTPGSVVMDDRIVFPNGYIPRNYENRYFGPTTLYEALEHSNNVVTVKLFRDLGFKKAFAGYRRFDMVEPHWDLKPEMPLCLGSLNVTPLSLAAAYLAFARQGVVAEPLCVRRVCDLDDRIIKTMRTRERRVISPQAAYELVRMLIGVVREGTGKPEIGDHFAPGKYPEMGGKTGTTSGCVDAWFAGLTPDLVLVVYVGFDQVRSMGIRMTGSRVAAPIWRRMMQRILGSRGDWKMEFDVPQGIVFRDISSRTGLLAPASGPNPGERILTGIPFVQGTQPVTVSQGYQGVPYWEYQHPDPNKNQIDNPAQIPDGIAWAIRPDATTTNAGSPDMDYGSAVPPPTQNRARVDEDLLAPPW